RVFLCYPNPTQGTVHLSYELTQGETAIWQIHDLRGQILESVQLDQARTEHTLSLANWPSGYYLGRIVLNDATLKTFRIVKIQ
ncbi:T9SS type A sorting domain-containing protein, partial [Acinetobacter baumannii]|nr:T9SS type A sorting domain-containing protein [Acinetobacter baumannii]